MYIYERNHTIISSRVQLVALKLHHRYCCPLNSVYRVSSISEFWFSYTKHKLSENKSPSNSEGPYGNSYNVIKGEPTWWLMEVSINDDLDISKRPYVRRHILTVCKINRFILRPNSLFVLRWNDKFDVSALSKGSLFLTRPTVNIAVNKSDI